MQRVPSNKNLTVLNRPFAYIYAKQINIDDMTESFEPAIDESDMINDELVVDEICSKLSPTKQDVVRGLIDGDNFFQIGKRLKLKPSEIYKIKEELKDDLSYLKTKNSRPTLEQLVISKIKQRVATGMSLSHFIAVFIADYDRRGDWRWVEPAIQDKVFDVWENETESPVVFADRRLKAITIISYLIRKLFLRRRPLVIDYYYNDRQYLIDLIKRFKQVIRNSPVIHDDFQLVPCDDDFGFKLSDGSAIRTFYDRGRKPANCGTFAIFDDGRDEIGGYKDTVNVKIIKIRGSGEVVNREHRPIIGLLG